MFHSRRSSQKPDEGFYAAFKQNFASLAPWPHSIGQGPTQPSSSLSETLIDANASSRPAVHVEDAKDHNMTPKGAAHDGYRFSPSVMDPNSLAFSVFANQPPGYCTPASPGGVTTLYHSQAGDLHTPGMGMSINTPLSLPQTAQALSTVDVNYPMSHYHPQVLQSRQLDNVSAYAPHQVFAPPALLQHQDSGYEAMSHSPHPSPVTAGRATGGTTVLPPVAQSAMHRDVDSGLLTASTSGGTSFRYQCTLNAPTAMVRHGDEIPISYLNKGQAYALSVEDTQPLGPSYATIRYRTYVRVSFEDEEQRFKPGACWQLWKEGRGSSEAHQRDGKLLAVEYVDTSQGGDGESRRPQVEIEHNSFDGFCVTWSPNCTSGRPECSISVRFNFLSTDFSHSKGVKGIPVRLCAKTQAIPFGLSSGEANTQPEVCYAKVKLFRDHGAERKLANDVAHVKKTIEKFKQQISQAELGMATFGKRRRSDSITKPTVKGPGKVSKDKRTWSMGTDRDVPPQSMTMEEDAVMKLTTMQDMFSSTRPVSVLYLRGDREDDPDLFPIHLPGNQQEAASPGRLDDVEVKLSTASTPNTSNDVSPTSSSNAIISPCSSKAVFAPIPLPPLQTSSPASGLMKRGSCDAEFSHSSTSQTLARPAVGRPQSGVSGSAINVLGIDAGYQAPPERPRKPVACFYVRRKDSRDSYYRAIYLIHRSVKDLIHAISEKFQMDPSSICRVTHLNSKGQCVVVDEDVVRELPEEQDMTVEFFKPTPEPPIKSEMQQPDGHDVVFDSGLENLDPSFTDGLEMWLNY